MNEWNNLPSKTSWVAEAKDLDKFKPNLDTQWHSRQYLTPFPSVAGDIGRGLEGGKRGVGMRVFIEDCKSWGV